ncbi:MAG TPA: cyclic nucleotide-binding domain-containing protein, partial [Polyangiales bacterium]|nr:cyclic nucleotide-binding domain-containing protein [Polyangiales bacterium]
DSAGLVYPDKLMPLPLFSLLDQNEFGAVLGAMRLLRVRPGSVILREGDPGTSFLVLARGTASVSALRAGEAKELAQLQEGAIFGEMALLSAAPRTATITARTECDLLEFDCAALGDASSMLANLADALAGFARERLLRNVVTTSPLFGPLDPKQRADLMKRFVTVEAPAQSLIIQEGSAGLGLYVLLRGEVSVTRGGADIARLGPGEMFGEMSLIQNEPTSASVTAAENGASLLFLSRDYFERLMAAVPELHAYLHKLTEDRLMDLRISLAPGDVYALDVAEDEIEVDVSL